MEEITSRTNKKILNVVALQKEKARQEQGLFVDEGFKNLLMALKNHLVKEVYTTKPLSIDDENVDVYLINEQVLDKITLNKNSDGIVFVAKIPSYDNIPFQKVVYLDNVQDPGNVGTIIRTSLAFGIDAVVLSPGCASIYNNKTLAAAKGAFYQIPVFSLNFDDLMTAKKEDQKLIVTTLARGSIDLEDTPRPFSYVLVFGNEGNGVRPEIQLSADYLTKIDIAHIDSLNVAVSAGIVLHHFTKNYTY